MGAPCLSRIVAVPCQSYVRGIRKVTGLHYAVISNSVMQMTALLPAMGSGCAERRDEEI